MLNTISSIIVYFTLIISGFLLKKFKILKEEDASVLTKIVLNLTLPSLVLLTFSNSSFEKRNLLIIFLPALFFTTTFPFYIIFLNFFRIIKYREIAIISFLGFNIGLFAYPFIREIFSPGTFIRAILFDTGNAIFIFGFSYIISYIFYIIYYEKKDTIKIAQNEILLKKFIKSKEERRAILRNIFSKEVIKKVSIKLLKFIPFQCYLIGLVFALVGIKLPRFITRVFLTISQANTPLVLLMLGLSLSFDITKEQLKTIFKILFLKYFLGISFIILLYIFFPRIELKTKNIASILFVMPPGMAIIPYSIEFRFNTKIASALVNFGNIISILLMIIVMYFLNYFNLLSQ
ncbi:MAG: AEC family transporter [Spirochaetes bacterium]|nr:AEC family transporter [Spirochaetota bacterium]